MPTQSLIFVAIPNGVTPGKTLRLSVHLSPRLRDGATLDQFPDMLKWASLLQKSGLTFELSCGGTSVKVPIARAVLRPDVWQAIFTPKTYVDPPKFPDYNKRLIVSYPVRDSLAFVKGAYQAVATNTLPNGEGQRGLFTLLEPLIFRKGSESTLDQAMAEMRVSLYNAQHPPPTVVINAVPGRGMAAPAGVGARTAPAVAPREAITRFALYHNMPPPTTPPPLPSSEADFAKTLDFHRAITALSSYPALLRALGLVFDLEVPETFCPVSPGPAGYGTITIRLVTAGFKWKIAPEFCTPPTAYLRDAKDFYPAPATAPAAFEQGAYEPGDVIDGLLALSPDNFHLLQMDLDGALLKSLSMADSFAYVDYRDGDRSKLGDALPALRSSGIGLVANERGAQLLQALNDNQGFDEAATTNGSFPRPLHVRDLTRGFRIDIFSARTGKWHSLHRRNGTYKIGAGPAITLHTVDEEGFLDPVAASPVDDPTRPVDPVATTAGIPQPGTDLFVHERIMRWDGWSLSAERPGKHLNRSGDPAKALDDDPTTNKPMTPFKLETAFTAMPGSLPQLRFGEAYRLRARAVDLAGNSIALSGAAPPPLILPSLGTSFTYLRFEPVGAPLVVLQQKPGPGGALERLIIRSYNSDPSLDTAPVTEVDNRHIAPPRSAVRMAEQHGELDDAANHLRGDAGLYNAIVALDAFEFPTVGKDSPVDAGASLKVQYIPDPIARGAALRDLPHAPGNTNGRLGSSGLRYATLPDVQPRAGSVTYIDFGLGWPDRKSFRLEIREGSAAPKWNEVDRVLSVSLAKSESFDVDLSSYLNPADLSLMGVWGWIREVFEAQELQAMSVPWAATRINMSSDSIALLTRLVLEGGHELLTPARTLNLVHAVQQPIGRPKFAQLPVVHQPSAPIFASALRNYFTPITAWRTHGSHSAVLLGGLRIHAASSARVDLQSRWQEVTDDLAQPGPKRTWNSHHVEKFELASTAAGALYADISRTRMTAIYIPQVDTLWFAAAFDELQGVDTPADVAAPLHRFDDTKHRWVTYEPVATSRFQECFADQTLSFTRTGDPLVVDVPSSARPLAPDIAYVVPTFGWEKQETTNAKSVVRFGNSLRVYLHRPWYSSGEDELLGVVLWPSAHGNPDYAEREAFKPYFTQWGNDPIWKSGNPGATPDIYGFPNALATAANLTLDGTPQLFDVAGHTVAYDTARQLWYCDILLRNNYSYNPFVRLALARYQTHSIQGVELSHVVLADYAQLAADRSAVVMIDTGNPATARVFIGGLAPTAPFLPVITVTVERRLAKVATDLGWEEAPPAEVTASEDVPGPAQEGAVLWSGTVHFTKTPPSGQYRIVIREFERIRVGPPVLNVPPPSVDLPVRKNAEGAPHFSRPAQERADLGLRLVYAAIIPYDYFPPGKA